MEVERALLEAEQESEVAALQQEKDALEALHNKMAELETKSQQDKEKVFNKLRFMPIHTLPINTDQKAKVSDDDVSANCFLFFFPTFI